MQYRLSDAAAVLVAAGSLGFTALGLVRGGYSASYGVLMPLLATSMLVVGAWWLSHRAPGTPFREMALPASVATVTPLLVGASVSAQAFVVDPAPWLLEAAAAATVGLLLADAVPDTPRTPLVLVTAVVAVLGATLGIVAPAAAFEQRSAVSILGVLLLAATTGLPGLVAATLRHGRRDVATAGRERENLLAALELAVIGLTPGIALLTVWGTGGSPAAAGPLVVWILVVLAAQYFAVQPLASRATVATSQRDAVVSAMEAERSRIAADIHDDALQELTMLGWRLDAAGDREGAATAREVADRLRAILGDLRLPIIDDLGTGPALEWLVDRVARLTGAELTLERADPVRPPADVELAFFRVAQEAISNAIRHGRPPIVVRYWTSPSAASLAIDDAGRGVAVNYSQTGDTRGFGLLNMTQRAEQIGALLNVRSWPKGGTRVTLEWRA